MLWVLQFGGQGVIEPFGDPMKTYNCVPSKGEHAQNVALYFRNFINFVFVPLDQKGSLFTVTNETNTPLPEPRTPNRN